MKGNHEKRFVNLYEAEADAVFRYCLYRTSNRETALDLSQETFTKFWDSLVKGTEIRNDRAFLFVIARNLVIDYYRKKKSLSLDAILEEDSDHSLVLHDLTDASSPETTAEGKFVLDKISELEPLYQQTVYMRFVEGLKPKDIAEILGLSANVVSVRITRGLKELRRITGYDI